MIEIANIRKMNSKFNAEFIVGDVEKTNLDSNFFDVVVIIDPFPHVSNPFTTLKETKRIRRKIILYDRSVLDPVGRYNKSKYKTQDVKEISFHQVGIKKIISKT